LIRLGLDIGIPPIELAPHDPVTLGPARAAVRPATAGGESARRTGRLVTLSAMVGAVMIARALGPTERSDEILRDVREAVRERRLL
jgi:hypothetical protein